MARKKSILGAMLGAVFGGILGGIAKSGKRRTAYKNPFTAKKPRKKKGYKYPM